MLRCLRICLICCLLLVGLAYLPSPVAAAPVPSAQQFDQALRASRDGSFTEALELWNAVIERSPQDGAAWSNRGNVRLALGDPEGAIADQSKAMQREKTDGGMQRSTFHCTGPVCN